MINEIINNLPGCIGESTIRFIIFASLSGIKGKKKPPIIIAWVVSIFAPVFCSLIPNDLFGWLSGYCISLVIFIWGFQMSILNGLLLSAIFHIYLDITENTAMAAMPIALATASFEDPRIQAIGLGIIILVTLILVMAFPVQKLFGRLCQSNIMVRTSVLLVYLISIGDVAMSKSFPVLNVKILPFMVVILLVFAVMFIFMAKQNQTILEEKTKLESYEVYQPLVEDLIRDVLKRQHDYDNRLQNMKALPCTCTTYDELASALRKGYESMAADMESSDLLKINMKIFAAMIFSKKKGAEKDGITVNVNPISQNLTSALPEYDLSRCAGILIDNAVEAVKALPPQAEGESYAIDIAIKHQDGRVEFTVTNPCNTLSEDFMDKLFKEGFTTKANNKFHHGIGLSNLHHIIVQNNGELIVHKLKLPAGDHLTLGFRV